MNLRINSSDPGWLGTTQQPMELTKNSSVHGADNSALAVMADETEQLEKIVREAGGPEPPKENR